METKETIIQKQQIGTKIKSTCAQERAPARAAPGPTLARGRLQRPLARVVAGAGAVALQHVAGVAAVRGHRAVAVDAPEVGHLDEAVADVARRGALGLCGRKRPRDGFLPRMLSGDGRTSEHQRNSLLNISTCSRFSQSKRTHPQVPSAPSRPPFPPSEALTLAPGGLALPLALGGAGEDGVALQPEAGAASVHGLGLALALHLALDRHLRLAARDALCGKRAGRG